MNTLVGSKFETALRILLLLEAAFDKELTENEVAALDFMVLYSFDFGITETNLHGNNSYRFSEFASRREQARHAIKQLVLEGLIRAKQTPNGFKFSINNDGLDFVSNLNSDYADNYYETAMQVLGMTNGKPEQVLTRMINQNAIESLRRE